MFISGYQEFYPLSPPFTAKAKSQEPLKTEVDSLKRKFEETAHETEAKLLKGRLSLDGISLHSDPDVSSISKKIFLQNSDDQHFSAESSDQHDTETENTKIYDSMCNIDSLFDTASILEPTFDYEYHLPNEEQVNTGLSDEQIAALLIDVAEQENQSPTFVWDDAESDAQIAVLLTDEAEKENQLPTFAWSAAESGAQIAALLTDITQKENQLLTFVWSDAEIELLKTHKDMTPIEIQKKFLPSRSVRAIAGKKRRLGLIQGKPRKNAKESLPSDVRKPALPKRRRQKGWG